MAIQDLLTAYISQVTTVISQETQPDTLDPNTIGDMGTDLADILYDYLPTQNRFVVTAGTATPTGGGDTDIYYRGIAGGIEVYRNILGTWALLATIPVGVTLPDGILVGLRTSVTADVVTVTSGAWSIANAKYAKSTQTQFTLAAKDANFDRWDLVYADTNNDILILTGVATLTPVKPTLPANTIEVDYIYVPAVGLAYPLSNPNTTVQVASYEVAVNGYGGIVINWQTDLIDGVSTYASVLGNKLPKPMHYFKTGNQFTRGGVEPVIDRVGGLITTVVFDWGYVADCVIVF